MNAIAGKFGLKFDANSTSIMMVPIAADNPVFSGVRSYLFGGGTTISVKPSARSHATVLLESINPEVPGALAVRVLHGKGAVLARGDAGSLGNPDILRGRIGQFEACRQMFHSLLPEGPLPAYGWREGMEVKVKLWHELGTAGYPEKPRLLDLPLDPAAQALGVKPRVMDLQAAASQSDATVSAAEKADKMRFALVRARWEIQCRLRIGSSDGRAFAATWVGPKGHEISTRLTPRGQFLDSSPADGELAPWRWALLGEVVPAPLDPQAQSGDRWTCPALAPLPHAQLRPAPILRQADALYRFEGSAKYRNRPCFLVTKSIRVDLRGLEPQELVDREYADYFGAHSVRFREGGQVCFVKIWIDAETRLPLRTELSASTGLVWTDRTMEDMFLSDHDWVTTEHRTERISYGTYGRKLVAEFEY